MPIDAFTAIGSVLAVGLAIVIIMILPELGPKVLRFLPISVFLIIWVVLANFGHERKLDSMGGLGSKLYIICDTEYTNKCYQVAVVEGKLVNLTELGICGQEGDKVNEYSYHRSWSWLTFKDYPSTYHLERAER